MRTDVQMEDTICLFKVNVAQVSVIIFQKGYCCVKFILSNTFHCPPQQMEFETIYRLKVSLDTSKSGEARTPSAEDIVILSHFCFQDEKSHKVANTLSEK